MSDLHRRVNRLERLASMTRECPVCRDGRLRPGRQVVVAGRTSSGKTCAALQVALSAARAGVGVAVFSLEMSDAEVVERLLVQACGPGAAVKPSAFTAAADVIKELPLHIDDSSSITMAEVGARALRVQRRGGLGVVVIDYLQLLAPSKAENRTRELELLSRDSKLLAKRLGVAVLMLAQLSRLADQERRPRMAHLRGSGAIEQDADQVILLDKPDRQSATPGAADKVTFIIGKNRHGRTGDVPLIFKPEALSFR